MPPHKEKRKHPRVRVSLTLNWGWTPECDFTDPVTSLSAGGCFVKTVRRADRGRALFVRFYVPGETILLAEVRYNLEGIGLGVEFVNLSERERGALMSLVEHYREAAHASRGRTP